MNGSGEAQRLNEICIVNSNPPLRNAPEAVPSASAATWRFEKVRRKMTGSV